MFNWANKFVTFGKWFFIGYLGKLKIQSSCANMDAAGLKKQQKNNINDDNNNMVAAKC